MGAKAAMNAPGRGKRADQSPYDSAFAGGIWLGDGSFPQANLQYWRVRTRSCTGYSAYDWLLVARWLY